MSKGNGIEDCPKKVDNCHRFSKNAAIIRMKTYIDRHARRVEKVEKGKCMISNSYGSAGAGDYHGRTGFPRYDTRCADHGYSSSTHTKTVPSLSSPCL